MNMTLISELSDHEIDEVAGGPSLTDSWGVIGAGLGTIALGMAVGVGSGGTLTPVGVYIVASGVVAVHAGLIGLTSPD